MLPELSPFGVRPRMFPFGVTLCVFPYGSSGGSHPTGRPAAPPGFVDADQRLTALAGDAGRQELYNHVNDTLDLVEDDPGNPRLRRRRHQQLPIWALLCPLVIQKATG